MISPVRSRAILVLAIASSYCLLPSSSSYAGALPGFEDASVSLSGSLRQIGLYTRGTDAQRFEAAVLSDIALPSTACVRAVAFKNCPAFDVVGKKDVGQGVTRLRVGADLSLRDGVSVVVVYDNEASYGTLDTLASQTGSGLGSESFLGAEGVLKSGKHYDWSHELYRGYIQLETQRFEFSLGRQRVAWGVGRLWTPIDRFSALPPLSLQPDDTPGIDGIDARFNFDGFSYLQFVYAPGGSQKEARYAARMHGVVRDADVSIMAGYFEEAPTVGVDFARNLGDAAIRFEAVFTSPDHKVFELGDARAKAPADFWQVVASFDFNFSYGTGVYFLAEYLYNGNALGFGKGRAGPQLPFFEATDTPPDPALGMIPGPYVRLTNLDRFGSSRVITLSAHQLGWQLGYDLTPELRFDFVSLIDAEAGSAAFFPNLSYSPLDSMETTLGVQLFAGPERSQFGASDYVIYFLADWFF